MQLGGNANALTHFAQQNCTTKDAQQKYHSRAAELYREKLSQSASKAQRLYGNKLHIDEQPQQSASSGANKETDFFQQEATQVISENRAAMFLPAVEIREPQIEDKSHEGPSVEGALRGEDPSGPVKSNILQKKPGPTKKVCIYMYSIRN